jgi:hypothetical protein
MPEEQQRSTWPSRLALAAIFLLLALLATRQVSSLDVGFHLTAGNSMLEGEGWPDRDRFTFTVNDRRYVDTSWGYQILLSLTERLLGAPGMVLLHVLLLLATFALVWRSARLLGGDPWLLLPLVLLGVLAGELRYEVRPELLSYLFLALLLHLLHRHAEGRSAPLWSLPLLLLVWANAHSLFILGWVVLACFVSGSWLQRRRIDRRLLGSSLAAVAVSFVNPYGWRGVLFPFTLGSRFAAENVFAQGIGEFQSPFDLPVTAARPFFPWTPILAYLVLFGLVVVALWPQLRARRMAAALLALPFLVLSAQMVRNLPLLVVACLPGVAWAVSSSDRIRRWLHGGRGAGRRRELLAATMMLVALLFGLRVYHDAYYVDARRDDRFGLSWNRLALPIDATDYLRQADLPGRGLNHLNFGGWLMWACQKPVFIDGRLEVIGEDFYRQYRRTFASRPALEAAVRRHEIGWIFFPFKVERNLLQSLSTDPAWRLTYYDADSAIFVRSDRFRPSMLHPSVRALSAQPEPVDLAGLPGLDAPRRTAWRHRLAGLFARQKYPSAVFGKGLFHYFRRSPRRSAPRFAEAVRLSQGAYYELYHNLGAALFRIGRELEARDCFRIVVEESPGNEIARQRLKQIEKRLAPRAPAGDAR